MDKSELIVSILGIFFFLTLIIYSTTSSGFTMFLHLLLLISGFLISVLMINKVTKSTNSPKAKIYFSFILNFVLFFLIIFFWFLGDHSSIDDMGLTTAFIIIPTSILFGIIGVITGLVLSIKRKTRKDFEYNLKPLIWTINILVIILVLIFFYNNIVHNISKISQSETLCSLSITVYYSHSKDTSGSYMFSPYSQAYCLRDVGILKNDEKICEKICDSVKRPGETKYSCEVNIKNNCYYRVTVNKKDIKICFNSPEPFDMSVRCGTAFSTLENEIHTILSNPSHLDVIYAIKTTPYLGVYYDESAEDKYIPLIKNVVTQGSLNAKKEALEILFTWAGQNSLEEEKIILREQILPLIENQPELNEYVTKINQRLNAVVLQPSTSSIRTE